MLRDGSYFGTLCALDPLPANLDESYFTQFELLGQLIAFELEAENEKTQREAQINALNDIISIAGHDLRQPLTSLLLRAQLLARQAGREKVSNDLLTSLQQHVTTVRRTISLTDRLLDVGRLETGNFKLEITHLDLVGLVQQIIDDSRVSHPAYTLMLHTPRSIMVEGDSTRLNQVISNLVDNAIKYSPYAQEPIEIRLEEGADTDQKSRYVLVTVKDQGMGVNEGDLGHLFERQYRAPEAKQAGINGSGFGLYIARQIIQAHGGHIWADSNPEGGLTVSFKLPLPG